MSFSNFFDRLSQEPKIFIGGKERYSTRLGAIMTIISYTLSFSLTLYQFINFAHGDGANVVSYGKSPDENLYIDISNYPLLFRIRDAQGAQVDSRILKVSIANYGNNKNSFLDIEPYLKSNYLKDTGFALDDSYQQLKQSNMFTPVRGKYNISLNLNAKEKTRNSIIMSIDICMNSTKTSNCFPRTYIDNYVAANNVFPLEYYIGVNRPKPLNLTNPFIQFITSNT